MSADNKDSFGAAASALDALDIHQAASGVPHQSSSSDDPDHLSALEHVHVSQSYEDLVRKHVVCFR